MWSPEIATQLQQRGYDVVAVAQRSDLRTGSDAHIFDVAQVEGWAIVTENARDFQDLARKVQDDGGSHPGLIFTSNKRYSRHSSGITGQLVAALDELLSSSIDLTNLEYWLP